MPWFHADFCGRQPYRIVLITEKSSLRPVLQPIAELVGGELLSMTGETSDTRIAELAKRAAADGRPTVVLYFSDHDPSGWQMPISVSRKLQGLRDLLYPDLDLQVRRAALTVEQANELDLPSTPLKETERRPTIGKPRPDGNKPSLMCSLLLPLMSCGDSPLKPLSHFSTPHLRAVSWQRLKNGTSPRAGCLHPIPNTAVSQSGLKTRTPR